MTCGGEKPVPHTHTQNAVETELQPRCPRTLSSDETTEHTLLFNGGVCYHPAVVEQKSVVRPRVVVGMLSGPRKKIASWIHLLVRTCS